MRRIKLLMLLISLCLSLMLVAVACAGPEPTPAVPSEPEPGVPGPTPGEVFKWKLLIAAAGTWEAEYAPILVSELEEVTGGRLKIDILFPGEHPYKAGDLLLALRERGGEIVCVPGYYLSRTEPGLGVLDLPMLFPKGDLAVVREVYKDLRKGYLADIWAEWNGQELWTSFWGGQQIFLKQGFVEDWDSLKGARVRSPSPELNNLILLLNGTPVSVAWGEVYTSLQTGLVDGLVTSYGGFSGTGLYEVAKDASWINSQYATVPFCVNKDAWAELPPDLQNTITSYIETKRDWLEDGCLSYDGKLLQRDLLNHGVKAKGLPLNFREEVRNKSYEAIWKPWIEGAGPSGTEAFNEVAKLLIEKGYTVPGYTPK